MQYGSALDRFQEICGDWIKIRLIKPFWLVVCFVFFKHCIVHTNFPVMPKCILTKFKQFSRKSEISIFPSYENQKFHRNSPNLVDFGQIRDFEANSWWSEDKKNRCLEKKSWFSKNKKYIHYGHQIWTPNSQWARSNPKSRKKWSFFRKKDHFSVQFDFLL